MSKNKTRTTKKAGPIKPNWRESKFAKTIDGQAMLLLERAIKNKHFIEAQIISWSTIEQLLLPKLISFIAKELKLGLPNDVYKLNLKSINYVYYCLSHDKKLYGQLEKGRKLRNKVVHRLYREGSMTAINKLSKESTKHNVLLQQEIMKRFDGNVLIPSLNLYRNGWNDGLNKLKTKILMDD